MVVLIVAVLIVEFLFMAISYDDHLDNTGWSILWGIVITLSVFVFNRGVSSL